MTRPITVLLLDDNTLVRESLNAWLTDDGFHVHAASNCAEAFRTLATTPIDFVMVDLQLPDMSGESFIVQAIERFPASHFAIHTGATCYRLSLELLNLGMRDDDVIYKPVSPLARLTEIIRAKTVGGGSNGT